MTNKYTCCCGLPEGSCDLCVYPFPTSGVTSAGGYVVNDGECKIRVVSGTVTAHSDRITLSRNAVVEFYSGWPSGLGSVNRLLSLEVDWGSGSSRITCKTRYNSYTYAQHQSSTNKVTLAIETPAIEPKTLTFPNNPYNHLLIDFCEGREAGHGVSIPILGGFHYPWSGDEGELLESEPLIITATLRTLSIYAATMHTHKVSKAECEDCGDGYVVPGCCHDGAISSVKLTINPGSLKTDASYLGNPCISGDCEDFSGTFYLSPLSYPHPKLSPRPLDFSEGQGGCMFVTAIQTLCADRSLAFDYGESIILYEVELNTTIDPPNTLTRDNASVICYPWQAYWTTDWRAFETGCKGTRAIPRDPLYSELPFNADAECIADLDVTVEVA